VAGAYIFVLKEFINLRVAAGVSFVCLLIAAFPPLVTVLSGVVRTHLTFLWGPVLNDPQVVYLFYLAALPFLMIYICNDLPCVVQLRDDVSYGVYLYGWPLAQSLIALAGVRQWTQLPFFLVTMLILLPIAFFSWRAVERPALRLKNFQFSLSRQLR